MITDGQLRDLIKQLAGTAEAIGGTLSPNAAAVIAQDLQQFDLDTVSLALAEVRRTARGRFSVGDVLRAIAQRDGRPHGDEAWAIAVSATDELSTVVLTEEIRMAMAVAQSVIDIGDMVGARRTFLMSYERFVATARETGKPVKWEVSLGSDKSGRVLAIQASVRLGRLPRQEAVRQLAMHTDETMTPDGQAIAGLLTGNVAKPSERNRARFAELRQAIVEGKARLEESEHQDALDRKADLQRRLEEHQRLIASLESDSDRE